MKKYIIFILLCSATSSYSNGIVVSDVSFNDVSNELTFTLTWDNSWLSAGTPNLFDAAWVFIKYAPNGGDVWHHASIIDSTDVPGYAEFIAYDDLGMIVYKTTTHSGTVGPATFTVELAPLLGGYQDFKVFATETVFIDEGPFYAGDASSSGRFYQNGDTSEPMMITSELGRMRGNGPGEFHQEGSIATENLTADFPKGYNSIFCMKYKITARQYMDFLNCLTRTQQNNRVEADLSGTVASNKYVMTDSPAVVDRNPIACDVNIGTGAIEFYLDLDDSNPPNSANDGANIVLNHLSPSDILAYLDWSGLRPISELEYEKFCRGTDMPVVAGEYAWGTDTYNDAGATTNSGTIAESTANVDILNGLFKLPPLRAGYAATASSDRTSSGGTFWGIMDIHNLGELLIGVESTNFKRTDYGDGTLDSNGNADVTDWFLMTQFLNTQDPGNPGILPVSQGKIEITSGSRLASLGGRGVRRVISE